MSDKITEIITALVEREDAGYGECESKCMYCHEPHWEKRGKVIYRHEADCPIVLGRKLIAEQPTQAGE